MLNMISKYKIWIVLLGLLGLLQVMTYLNVSQYNQQLTNNRLQVMAEQVKDEIQQSILDKQKATTAIALTLSYELSKHNSVNEKIEISQDFDDLVKQIKAHSAYKNLWVQFVDSEGLSLYRSWSPIRNSLAKIRPEFNLTKEMGMPVQSVSSGVFDVSIKVVTPVFKGKTLIGYLDLISHFNSIQYRLEKQNTDTLVIATKARSKLLKYPFSSNKIGQFYVANLHPNQVLFRQIDETTIEGWNQRGEEYWVWRDKLVIKHPLIAPNDQVHGYVYAFKTLHGNALGFDFITNVVTKRNNVIMFDVTLSIVLIMGMALLLMRKQKSYYQDILNYEEEAVLVTNGKELIDANNQLYIYFPELSRNNKGCICDLFEKEEGFLQKHMGNELWIDYLLAHPGEQNKILIKHHSEFKIFQVKARRLDQKQSLSVVVLTEITELEKLNRLLHEQSRTDELTGTGNRWYFNEVLDRELALAKRKGNPLSLVSFDIDHFKKVNDTYGHTIGDEVLQILTDTLKDKLRQTDAIFRVGGEEFIVILSGQELFEAEVVAEKLRLAVYDTVFNEVGKVTISLGVTQMNENDEKARLLVRVDEALYNAKESGRNRVFVV